MIVVKYILLNDILFDMNRQHVSLLVLVDLSAAFDTVDHAILLRPLETSFCVTGDVLKWFASYLSGRFRRIAVNGKQSVRQISPIIRCSSRVMSRTAALFCLC